MTISCSVPSSPSIRYDSNASASDSSEEGDESEDESAKKKKAKKVKVVKEKKERKPRKEVREGGKMTQILGCKHLKTEFCRIFIVL